MHKLFTKDANYVTLTPDGHAFRADLEELERRLIAALITVQRALGKESSIRTGSERRAR